MTDLDIPDTGAGLHANMQRALNDLVDSCVRRHRRGGAVRGGPWWPRPKRMQLARWRGSSSSWQASWLPWPIRRTPTPPHRDIN
jgi:hypothetical protein